MANGVSLVATNIHFLQQGLELLKDLNDKLFLDTDSAHYNSSVGKHFRHALEHYTVLLQCTNDRIDYDGRERNERIETDKEYAIQVAEDILSDLNEYKTTPSLLDKEVWIKNNEGASNGQGESWSKSCLQREFQFLISHAVHHYALIAIILRIQGYQPAPDFGLAPSTLRYQEQTKEVATK